MSKEEFQHELSDRGGAGSEAGEGQQPADIDVCLAEVDAVLARVAAHLSRSAVIAQAEQERRRNPRGVGGSIRN